MGLYKRLTECLLPSAFLPPPALFSAGSKFICASWSSGQVFVFDRKRGVLCRGRTMNNVRQSARRNRLFPLADHPLTSPHFPAPLGRPFIPLDQSSLHFCWVSPTRLARPVHVCLSIRHFVAFEIY